MERELSQLAAGGQGENSPKGIAHCTPEPHLHPPRRHPLPLGGEGQGEGAGFDFEVHGRVVNNFHIVPVPTCCGLRQAALR
jgi:hypothetical protein